MRHMAWANQRLFAAVAELPDEALSSYLVDPEFDVATILHHIVDGAEWFAFCAGGHPWSHREKPRTGADVLALARNLAELDALVMKESQRDDVTLTINHEDGDFEAKLSTVISQAPHHATEHRAQLVAALELRGYRSINLDDLDLWCFERFEEGRSGRH